MWDGAGLADRCGSQTDNILAPGRLVVNVRSVDDYRGAGRRAGPPSGIPGCNAAAAGAELQPTVVAAARLRTGVSSLLKGADSVFNSDKLYVGGLLGGALKC
jgi:hypothetical protein